MKIMVGIANEESAQASGRMLRGAGPGTEVRAVAVVPRRSRLAAALDLPRRQGRRHLNELQKLEQEQANQLLSSFKATVERPGLTVETSVQLGDPSEELIRASERWGADLVLVTRKKAPTGSAEPLGHVAGRVARYSHCTVLLLDQNKPVLKTILLATDGSPQADLAGKRVRQLPLEGLPSLLVCTVTPVFGPTFVKTGSIEYASYQRLMAEIQSQEREASQEILNQAAASFSGLTYRIRQLTYSGDTAEALLRAVQEQRVDLLAVGAKGISATASFLVGSVTLKLLNRAHCSILIAR